MSALSVCRSYDCITEIEVGNLKTPNVLNKERKKDRQAAGHKDINTVYKLIHTLIHHYKERKKKDNTSICFLCWVIEDAPSPCETI